MKGLKFRFSKKLVFILMGSIVVLGGGSGAAAVLIGTDKILGPSYLEINGLECTALETVKIKRDQRYWVRKYVVSDEAGDGLARIRTALRVAKAVQEKEKADLVQVAMIDKAGPRDRAQMRGRAIGAQVVYIPDPKKAPEGTDAQPYSAYYLDGTANSNGEYYGMRVDLPLEDVEALTARLTDHADCVGPVVATPEGEHGQKPKADGHGAPSAPAGHGEPVASSHGAAPADGHGAPAEGQGGEVAAKESGGFLSSVTGMIFGSGKEAPAQGHAPAGNPAAAETHAAAPAAAAPPAPAADAHAAPAAPNKSVANNQALDQSKGNHKPATPAQVASAEPKKEEGGFLASVMGMFSGGGEQEKPGAAPAAAKASEPAPAPRTSAEGGKRWSKQTDGDAVRSDAKPPETPHAEAAPAKPAGATDADAAGAEWLAKLRGQAAPAAPAKPAQAASASDAKDPAGKVVH
ncbi:hypothetical protein NOJ28_12645 [Neorhizobium galegae]|uniref:hypothetical protein n=1 Tax=Neorhizobium galegae TaxID=399 RepID=UPI0006228D16|nr:hypothetical protein [Neorhizobium galegae]MCQ1766384.1 hypothetical protein [Neorhizobium galegae]MCQ1845298.1 hypothetical protein [Neorhizobium galegae]CDZ36472.1 Hypothetical protein NGAL_HAMBI1146_18910 [Neorhizobium galegae bv. officinalis]